MFSPEDEQDDQSIFDQLKCIRPFTIDQLYLLHPDVSCPPKAAISIEQSDADENGYKSSKVDVEIYQHLVEFEQLKNQLIDLKHDIKKLYKKAHGNIDEAWTFKEESTRKIAMCQQGKIAETTFKYKQAHIDKKHLDRFAQDFNDLIEKISKEYVYYSFESQMKRNKIATHLSISYQTPELETRKEKIKSAIVTLMEFIRYLGDTKSDFTTQCRKWLRTLTHKFLEEGLTEDYRFIISQLAKGPVGTADWSADLVECKPYEQVSGFDSVPQYITHCSALLSELFYNLQLRIRHMKASSSLESGGGENSDNDPTSPKKTSDQDWSLVDPRFSCTEELNISSNQNNLLSESDVIKFCLRIPVAQIFRAYVKKCLDSTDEFRLETDKNYEFVMLKLLTIGTIIIKTYQIGLETFNSIQYGSLIEYLSSQIRRTVLILSDQWAEFKHRLKGIDDALFMRLQVEYDNFMLRSILVILELRESGIWRHLSRIDRETEVPERDEGAHGWATDSLRPAFQKLLLATGISGQQQSRDMESPSHVTEIKPENKDNKAFRSSSTSLTYEFSLEWFKEVSEPMLWHILWQFYHNGFMNSCDYHSDGHWLKKFQEKSVVYLFVNKIRDSPKGECSYLVNSITSMLLSRTNHDSKLVNFIAGEIFNLTFKHHAVREKVDKVGLKSLIRSAEKFPKLISLYISLMKDSDLEERATELFRGCSLSGWLCDDEEMLNLEKWLIDTPLTDPRNKISRLIITKILLNNPSVRCSDEVHTSGDAQQSELFQGSSRKLRCRRRLLQRDSCFVNLKMRRRLALLLYKSSIKHYPENNEFGSQSLGASIELEFGSGLYCEQAGEPRNSLSELATDSNYQQFYIWIWRILFSLRLHILNQPETDWNDVQTRSGTSRSTRNTVLINDPFYPVPSIDDIECLELRDGTENQNPIASFIYLILTDATWKAGTLDLCVTHLNVLANSGHITPSLMAMKFLTISHLSDLLDVLVKDKKCIEYFSTIILSNFDATRLASLIATQLDHLKQYRKLQLSHFYVSVLLEVNKTLSKRIASSWFSSNEVSFEKIACLLDHLVRFNFTTQRLEITRKFYDCAYVIQDGSPSSNRTSGWLSSLVSSSSIEKDLSTNLHLLSQKFRKYTWLQWVNTECDALRLEKIWEDIVAYLSTNEDATLDSTIKKVCPNINASSLKLTLPIFSWIRQIFEVMESDLNHPLCPLIWYNFFLNYFANSLNGVSVGSKLISQETVARLLTRLDSLFNYHTYKQSNWSPRSVLQQDTLTSLYRAYKLWLQDPSLRDAYIDIDRLREEYLVPLLKSVMESSQADDCLRYIDLQSIDTQNMNLMQVWIASTRSVATDNTNLNGSILCFDNTDVLNNQTHNESMNIDEDMMANDAVSLIVRSYKNNNASSNGRSLDTDQDELAKPLGEDSFGEPKYQTCEELLELVKKNFRFVVEEANIFGLNLSELERTRGEILDLVQELYNNEKKEFVRVVPCVEGNDCPGPARIKFEAAEALLDERKSQCIQDRRRQCQELVGELLLMPKNRIVQSTVLIEENVKRLINDSERSKLVIETLLPWLSEPANYNQLNGCYYVAQHMLKTTLDILSTTNQIDTYNRVLIDVCLAHPESVQILSPHLAPSACPVRMAQPGSVQIISPHLSPSTCSTRCFLDLYKMISSKQVALGPMATFVLLSKFDLNSFLNRSVIDKDSHHELIRTTCSALKVIGLNRDESCELTSDLFKRHLQIELTSPSRRQPEEFILVLNEFLTNMSEGVLTPNLWLDFLTILGLEFNVRNTKNNTTGKVSLDQRERQIQMIQESNISVESIAEDVARLAETQLVFDQSAAYNFLQNITNHTKQARQSNSISLLELNQDYVEQFGMVMLSATFIWLKLSSSAFDSSNHELIWGQFIDLWRDWVLITKDCRNVSQPTYNLATSYFVVSLRYMMHKSPISTCPILQSLLSELTDYVAQADETIRPGLTILQRSLKALPWSNLIATPVDIGNLAALSEQTTHNLSDLIGHVLLEMNTKECLARIHQSEPMILPHVMERLATIIVLQSSYLKGYKLHRKYFNQLPVAHIPRLAGLILARTEFNNLENSATNKLLIELLRYICFECTLSSSTERHEGFHVDDVCYQTQQAILTETFDRAVIFADFVSNYLVDLIKRHPAVATHNGKYLNAVINNSLIDLEPILLSAKLDMDQKTTLLASLLKCCSCDALESNSRLLLAKSAVESHLLRNKPELVVVLVRAISQSLQDSRILVLMVENLVESYRDINGHYEKVWNNFELRSIAHELYLSSCVHEKAPLAMMIYFESLFNTNQQTRPLNGEADLTNDVVQQQRPLTKNQIWSRFFQWLASMTQSMCNLRSSDQLDGPKLTIAWIRVLEMFESDLNEYLSAQTDPNIDGSESSESGKPDKVGKTDDQEKSVVESSENELTRSSAPESLPEQSLDKATAVAAAAKPNTPRKMSQAKSLRADHEFMLNFIKQLVAFYDSINTSGLWSYLKSSTRSEGSYKISVRALAVACFLTDQALAYVNKQPIIELAVGEEKSSSAVQANPLREELAKMLRTCLGKLESARKSKNLLGSAQFIETLVESVQHHEKVQYSEIVQLIKNYARAH